MTPDDNKENRNKNVTGKARSLLNLRPPVRKGEVLNPHGRPKKEICIPDMLREMGDRPVPPALLASLRKKYGAAHDPKTMREAVLLATYAEAVEGDTYARQFIAERTEGKVTEKLEVEEVAPARVVFEEIRLEDAKPKESDSK